MITALSWGNTIYIHAKAILAQHLIADAWQDTLSSNDNHYPWSWADSWPVAALRNSVDDKTHYVLSGAHGTSLAFGPGHVDGTGSLNGEGTSVISGHRDTHFRFLRNVQIGDFVELQDRSGNWKKYIITNTTIRDVNEGDWQIDLNRNELHLITCYPFDAVSPGGPLRFIAIAEPEFNQTSF